jgi:DNA-binding NtrC family response regulator
LKEASRVAAAETERRMIVAALDLTEGNITRAADRLGLSRRGLQIKMKELELR